MLFWNWIRLITFGLVIAIVLTLGSQDGLSSDFSKWLLELRSEALERGISEDTLINSLDRVTPIKRVIELDRSQPETILTLQEYIKKVVTSSRIEKGRRLLAKNRILLEKVYRVYGVPPRFIVSLWGIETNFGDYTGGFSVIAALATLAHDGRRSSYFRSELLTALKILDEGHVSPKNMVGSWAGAMGQNQFMPSSFVNFAIDFDRDGRRDIWENKQDIFASTANYLSKSGWKRGQTWGREILLPDGFDYNLANPKIQKSLGEWQALGVKRINGEDLPSVMGMMASIVVSNSKGAPVFLAYNNFRTILKWNRSNYFAIGVGTLADLIVKK